MLRGIYSFACIRELKDIELAERGLTADIDPELTDQCFDLLEENSIELLRELLYGLQHPADEGREDRELTIH